MDPCLAARRICVAVDVENYSGRGDLAQESVQRDLAALLRGAHAAAAPAVALARQASGDGEVALVDPPADEGRFLASFVHSLWTGLGEEGAEVPFRLRVAVHCGMAWLGDNGFVGRAVVKTCRMLDAQILRAALRDDPGTRLALMVSDSFYDDVVRRDPPGLAANRFTQVRVGGPFDADAWIWTGGRTLGAQPAHADPGRKDPGRSAPERDEPGRAELDSAESGSTGSDGAAQVVPRAEETPRAEVRVPAPAPAPPMAAMSVTVHPDARVGTLIQAAEIVGGVHLEAGRPPGTP
ncbi:hypothetical protein [Actinocorallia sp. A-T 12471]|uniref:hypothetical protein n=1 Tax=Actinocorallia sp. A-T 12471 TaxID=3089813 RepID=UPI0029CEBC10|nr:hypothetical protein [Actinocorallia sp. A-T 12471]MDX6741972.1 hypothetical protein [Actinocorallia sp. A-T 12471]